MSLISPKNFMAPFKNMVNLGLIIVIAVIFALYRLSGGGVNISNRKNIPQTIKEAPAEKTTSRKDPVVQEKPVSSSNKPSDSLKPSDDDQISDLLSEGLEPEEGRKIKPRNNDSLDDIAKQLGVE